MISLIILYHNRGLYLAERKGFEPLKAANRLTRFPGVPVQPLLHLSWQ